jgi:hypothetical protein
MQIKSGVVMHMTNFSRPNLVSADSLSKALLLRTRNPA